MLFPACVPLRFVCWQAGLHFQNKATFESLLFNTKAVGLGLVLNPLAKKKSFLMVIVLL
jgi:hypothetical protein